MKKQVPISKIKVNPDNPRVVRDHRFEKLCKSLREFPEMMEKRPIIVDENMIVLGGNMRLRAAQKIGLKKVWIDSAEGWTDEQKREFIIKDNLGYGEWDFEVLANAWDIETLDDWGLEIPGVDVDVSETDISDQLELSFAVEVSLNSEEEQESLYNNLTKQGYSCRLLTL